MRFDNKVVVVTGGGGGIGSATCKAFAREGARVVVSDDSTARGSACVDEIVRSGGQAIFVLTDVSVAAQVEHLFDEAVNSFGGVDILFNNNGMKRFGSVTETTEDLWDHVINTNLKGMFLCAKSCIPLMLQRGGGVIINNGFVNLKNTSPRTAAYAASKAGIVGLTRSMSIDYGHQGIRVNCISPASIDTPMMTEVLDEFGIDNRAEVTRDWAAMMPAQQIGQPEQVADLVVFLASDQATFIHSVVIEIHGGSTTYYPGNPAMALRGGGE